MKLNWESSFLSRVLLIYFIVASLWILISERLLLFFFPDPDSWFFIQLLKGLFFVLVTSILFFLLFNRRIAKLEASGTGILEDISNTKLQDQQLKQTQQRLREIVENSTNMFYIHNTEREVMYVSPRCRKILGCEPEEAIEKWAGFFTDHPQTQEGIGFTQSAIEKGSPHPAYEVELQRADETKIWVEVNETPIVEEGKTVKIIGSMTDVTFRKEAEQQLRDSLEEKEVLLEEVNHRVKNNLAVISAILQLQVFETTNTRIRDLLLKNINRIQSMAHIHELLYQAGSLSKINFAANLKQLFPNIIETIQIPAEIQLNIEHLRSVTVNVNQALPASLLLNEVMTCTLRHSFHNRERGRIAVNLAEVDEDIQLEIIDDGGGLPPDLKIDESFELQLVQVLADQLSAEYDYERGHNRNSFTLTFKKKEIKGVANAKL